jgi:LuxR family quorum sensing-dependent transcriptional regulator
MDGAFKVETFAFDIIDRMRGLDQAGIIRQLAGLRATFGFTSMILAGIPNPSDPLQPHVVLQDWPEGWSERYHEQNYGPRDGALQRVHSSVTPFKWSDTRDHADNCRNIVLDEACEFRMNDGFIVPLRGAGGFKSALSFGTDKYMISKRDESAIHLIALYAFQALSAPAVTNELTPRERESVRWLAAGKTAWETGGIIGVSEETVKDFLRHAREKTGTVNGPHLVAECLRRGWM